MILDSLSQRGGGMEVQAVTLGRYLRKLGVEVHYLARAGDFSHIAEDEFPFIHTYSLLPGWLPGPFASLVFLLQNLSVLARYREAIVILHAHAISNGLVAGVAAKLFRKPALVKIASAGPKGEIARHQHSASFRQRLNTINQLSAIVATTPEVEKELVENGYRKDNIVLIPNGVDATFFRPVVPLKNPVATTPRTVVCVARFVPKKRHDLLIEAWLLVVKQIPQVRLTLVGEGPLRVQIVEKVSQLGLTKFVTFTGDLDRLALLERLQSASLFVLPSVSEGLSNAMLEALACAVPVVTTKTQGTSYIIQDQKSGVLLPEKVAPQFLADTIIGLLSEPIRMSEMGQMARQDIVERFSIEQIAYDYRKLYTKLLVEAK